MKKDYDPQMHSAEHILNQTMDRFFNCGRCVTSHIEKKKSKCDYRLHRPLTRNEIERVQKQVNDIIRANLPVTERYLPKDEAARQFNLQKLPETADDPIRIVAIGDYDACPCIGGHVRSTKEIGSFHITSTDYKDGIFRIRFNLTAFAVKA
jgi:misacylated tRNA(Ala) deacylase